MIEKKLLSFILLVLSGKINFFLKFCKFGKLEIIGLGKSYGKQSLTVYKMSKNMGIPKKKIFNFPKSLIDKAWKIEVEDFYNSILKSKKSNPNIKDVYENLKIINKIYKK